MTQRFGRNKRRAAREAIAAAKLAAARADEARQRADARAAHAMSEWAILERDVDHIVTTLIQLLGDANVVLPLRYTRELKDQQRIDRWPVKHGIEPIARFAQAIPERTVVSVVHLLRLVAEVNRAPERIGVHIRFRDQNDTGQFPGAGIFVSLQEFRRQGFTPEFVDHLMLDIRNRFIRYFEEQRFG